MRRPPPSSTLFPYTTLFRSLACPACCRKRRPGPHCNRCGNTTSRPTSVPTERATSPAAGMHWRSEEHTSELQSHHDLVCRLLLEKKNPHPLAPADSTQQRPG